MRSHLFLHYDVCLLTNNRVGWDKTLSFLPYNDQLRSHRKKAHLCLKSEASISSNGAIQEIEVGQFLLHLLRDPDRLVEHIQKYALVQTSGDSADISYRQAGSVIVKVVYGYTAEQFKPDPLLSTVRKVVDEFGIAAKPGAFMVDLIPIRKVTKVQYVIVLTCSHSEIYPRLVPWS